jgi:large subunit ribosomal protein L4
MWGIESESIMVAVLNAENNKIRDIATSDAVQGKVNKAVLYYALKAARNALRHGTASVKDRSAVNMTNKKIYRQKGTGNARHAARSANLFVGGGSAHGPRPRSYVEGVNRSFVKTSYREVFKYLIQKNGLKLLDKIEFAKPSTQSAAGLLKTLGLSKTLVVLPKDNLNAQRSFRNLRDVKVINEQNLNVLDICRYENVVMLAPYFEALKAMYDL